MTRPFSLFLLTAVLAASVPGVLAQDDEDKVEDASGSPSAADAARDKGYRAEGTSSGVTNGDAPSGPSAEPLPAPAPRSSGGASTPPASMQRPPSSAGGGAASSTAGGISCENSVPKLTRVHHKVLPDLACLNGRVFDYWMLPNEAISYRFKAPESGTGNFSLYEATDYPAVPMMATISEIPCDFAVSGGANANGIIVTGCSMANAYPNVSFQVGGGKGGGGPACILKAGRTYYYNIRFLNVLGGPGEPASVSDACANLNKQFPGAKDPRCGGIFRAQSNIEKVVDAAACAGVVARRQFVP